MSARGAIARGVIAAALLPGCLAVGGCTAPQGEFLVLDEVRVQAQALPARGPVFLDPPRLTFDRPRTFDELLPGWQELYFTRVKERAAGVDVRPAPSGDAPAPGLRVETVVHMMMPTELHVGQGDLLWAYATVLVRDADGQPVWRGRLETNGVLRALGLAGGLDLDQQGRLAMHSLACAVATLVGTGKPTGVPPIGAPGPWARPAARTSEAGWCYRQVADVAAPAVHGERERLSPAQVAELLPLCDQGIEAGTRALEAIPPHAPSDVDAASARARSASALARCLTWRGVLASPEAVSEPSPDDARAYLQRAVELLRPIDADALLESSARAVWLALAFGLRRQAGLDMALAHGEVSPEARALLVEAADLWARSGGEWEVLARETRRLAGQ